MYYKALNLFTSWEIKNSEHVVDLFSNIVGLNQTLIERDTTAWAASDAKGEGTRINF